MSTDKLREIKERWAKASPKPWTAKKWASEAHPDEWVVEWGDDLWLHCEDSRCLRQPDAEAIAAAPEDIAWLISEVERLRGYKAFNPDRPTVHDLMVELNRVQRENERLRAEIEKS